MAEIILKHIYKRYDDGMEAIRDFNLKIEDKEFVVFVGPSGCGKSTTLRMIAGLESISDGKLFIDGVQVNNVSAADRDMAMVFQNYALYPHMTVEENIGYSLRIAKMPKKEIREKVLQVARMLDIEQVLDRKPKELSGGQKQRVAMGRAIVRQPKAFLMDEPLSNLDAKLRTKMRGEIKHLHEMLQTTFIYVTHDQTEAMTLGSKIVVMKDGIIQQVATPKELYEAPANEFVAQFIGIPQMNLLEAKMHKTVDGYYLKLEGESKFVLNQELGTKLAAKGYVGKNVIVGIRPEDVKLEQEGPLQATIDVYELLGSESYVYFPFCEKRMSAKIRADLPVKVKDTIRFTFLQDKLHLFDQETGERI